MATSQATCVFDSSTIIHLFKGRIIQEAFQLSMKMIAPDVIVAEVELGEPTSSELIRFGLQPTELSGNDVAEVMRLRASSDVSRKVSTNDLFAFVLASLKDAVLVTGDKNLRTLAEEHGIRVHGTLWIMDELVRQEIISKAKAVTSLQVMLQSNCFLPKGECSRRLNTWSES